MVGTAMPQYPICMGINTQFVSRTMVGHYSTHYPSGHALVYIPGGHTVIGSYGAVGFRPHWIELPPYFMDQTPVSESKYRDVMGRPGNELSPLYHPVTMISYNDALEYVRRVRGARTSLKYTLPTETQWENAARGPAVNIPEIMEEETGRFTPGDIADFIEGRFENLVFEVLGKIFPNAKGKLFQRLIRRGWPFFGWRVYGTRSGRLNHDEVWYDRKDTTDANWGPENAYGLYGMTGSVWEWTLDWYLENAVVIDGIDINPNGSESSVYQILRGGAWFSSDPMELKASYRRRTDFLNYRDSNGGFRLVELAH